MGDCMYMFDNIIDRRGTGSVKWDSQWQPGTEEDMLHFWIADMDFQAAAPVLDALRSRIDHGVFGYTARPESLIEALCSWHFRRHQWFIEPESLLEIPGIVPFIHIFIQFFTKPGDAVVIQEPAYFPFRQAVERNRCRIVENPLIKGEDQCWRMDLQGLEQIFDESDAQTLILCSPHNPVGRVWAKEELLALADLCRIKGVTVLSDEIHADLIQPGFHHHPWLTQPEERLPQSLSLISPSKTFNLPGLNNSWAVIPDENFRTKIAQVIGSLGLESGAANPLVYTAAETAWREGGPWVDSLIDYIGKNYLRLLQAMSEIQPTVDIAPLEGTFLAWLEFASLGISDTLLWKKFLNSGLRLSRGVQFGKGGEMCMRMNLACPGKRLDEGVARIIRALS